MTWAEVVHSHFTDIGVLIIIVSTAIGGIIFICKN